MLFAVLQPLVASEGREIYEQGFASWYGGKFQGRKTANGEIFDTRKLTAAHKSISFGTVVEVENLSNGKTVEVRINDRGPFVEGRIIDLSRAAADEIDMVGSGVARVALRIVSTPPGGVPQDLYRRNQGRASYRIQVASFSNTANAERNRRVLEAAGIKVVYERSSAGHYRLIIPEVAAEELDSMKQRLRDLGYPAFLLRSSSGPES